VKYILFSKCCFEKYSTCNYAEYYELFYGDWYGTRVPSGTVKSVFLEPLIKTLDYMVPCFDPAQIVRYDAQVLLYEKKQVDNHAQGRLAVLTPDRDA
jgi:hypothetical protein